MRGLLRLPPKTGAAECCTAAHPSRILKNTLLFRLQSLPKGNANTATLCKSLSEALICRMMLDTVGHSDPLVAHIFLWPVFETYGPGLVNAGNTLQRVAASIANHVDF